MSATLPIKVYETLEKRLGKEEAKEVIEALESSIDAISLQRKLEVKDELTKELATKADIARLEGEVQTVRQEIQTVRQEIQTVRVDVIGKLKLYFLILAFIIILVNPGAVNLIAKLFGIIR